MSIIRTSAIGALLSARKQESTSAPQFPVSYVIKSTSIVEAKTVKRQLESKITGAKVKINPDNSVYVSGLGQLANNHKLVESIASDYRVVSNFRDAPLMKNEVRESTIELKEESESYEEWAKKITESHPAAILTPTKSGRVYAVIGQFDLTKQEGTIYKNKAHLALRESQLTSYFSALGVDVTQSRDTKDIVIRTASADKVQRVIELFGQLIEVFPELNPYTIDTSAGVTTITIPVN